MNRNRRRFGRLFYVTAALAAVVLLSRPFWQMANEQYTAWRLVGQLRDPTESTRRQAASELVRLGPAATSWAIRAMRDKDPVVRELACSIVVQTMPQRPDRALAALLGAATDSDPGVRQSALPQFEMIIHRYGSAQDAPVRASASRRSAGRSTTIRPA